MVDRVRFGAETARGGPGRASVGRPHRLAIPVDGDAVGAAPRPCLQIQLCPIPDHAIGIGAAVDRLNFVGLRGASPLLRLNAGSLQRNPDDDDRAPCNQDFTKPETDISMLLSAQENGWPRSIATPFTAPTTPVSASTRRRVRPRIAWLHAYILLAVRRRERRAVHRGVHSRSVASPSPAAALHGFATTNQEEADVDATTVAAGSGKGDLRRIADPILAIDWVVGESA